MSNYQKFPSVERSSERTILCARWTWEISTFASLYTGIIENFFNLMEEKHLRVLVVTFWSGSSTSDFYKIIKDSHCDFEVDSIQNNHLSWRYVADKSNYKWSWYSQGYIDFSIAESRPCYKSKEICSSSLAKDRVSRIGNRVSQNHNYTTTGRN